MIPDDQLVCVFVEPPLQTNFTRWPMHVTIVPWFRTPADTDDLSHELSVHLSDIKPFTAVAGEEAGFGFRGRKKVNLIELPSPFQDIEHIVRNILHGNDSWIVDETTKKKRQFLPHVTVQGTERLNKGDTFVCDNVYIVVQKGDHKEIRGIIEL